MVKGRAHMLWRELGAQYAQPGARNAFSLACIILRARGTSGWTSLPFLEDDACSIHPHRPSVCREYLVTSPAEHCAELGRKLVKRVPVSVVQ